MLTKHAEFIEKKIAETDNEETKKALTEIKEHHESCEAHSQDVSFELMSTLRNSNMLIAEILSTLQVVQLYFINQTHQFYADSFKEQKEESTKTVRSKEGFPVATVHKSDKGFKVSSDIWNLTKNIKKKERKDEKK